LTAFLLGNIYIPGIFFAERDHLIALGLFPLLLTQFAIGEGYRTGKAALYISLIFGSVAVLMKPHYGLLPAFMILRRIIKDKSLKAILKPDTIILCTATLAYAAICFLFFKEYVTQQLPDIWRFYVPLSDPDSLIKRAVPA